MGQKNCCLPKVPGLIPLIPCDKEPCYEMMGIENKAHVINMGQRYPKRHQFYIPLLCRNPRNAQKFMERLIPELEMVQKLGLCCHMTLARVSCNGGFGLMVHCDCRDPFSMCCCASTLYLRKRLSETKFK